MASDNPQSQDGEQDNHSTRLQPVLARARQATFSRRRRISRILPDPWPHVHARSFEIDAREEAARTQGRARSQDADCDADVVGKIS